MPAPASWLERRLGRAMFVEVGVLGALALPVAFTYVLSFMSNLVAQVAVGHLSAEALAAAALANLYANAFGNSIIFGASSAVDTLAAQAYGARNWPRVGLIAQRGCAVSLAMAVPVALSWTMGGQLLRALGQDETLAVDSQLYLLALIPGLPASVLFEVLKKYLLAVGLPTPPMAINAVGVAISIILHYVLVFRTSMGFMGSPLAIVISQWSQFAACAVYITHHRRVHTAMKAAGCWRVRAGSGAAEPALEQPRVEVLLCPEPRASPPASPRPFAPATGAAAGGRTTFVQWQGEGREADSSLLLRVEVCASTSSGDSPSTALTVASTTVGGEDSEAERAFEGDIDELLDATWTGIDLPGALRSWPEYLQLGLPSAAMLFSEWASYEATSLIAGFISTGTLAAHTIIATTASLSFMPALGIGVAVAIRVGRAMGDNSPADGQIAYRAALFCGALYVTINGALILTCGALWASFFTHDETVVSAVARSIWLLALYTVFDSAQCLCSGVLRGLGRPLHAAAANILSYVVVGLGGAWLFAVTWGVGLSGIWIAYTLAVVMATGLMGLVLARLDWAAIAEEAQKRALAGDTPVAAH
jgi:Na+-driven multidrug efflux pump